ncbi:hypothetical protein TrRE_jg9715, partial [Triparma retinervis]
ATTATTATTNLDAAAIASAVEAAAATSAIIATPTTNLNLSFTSTTLASEATVISKKPDYDSVPFPPPDPVEPKVLSTTTKDDGTILEVCVLPKLYVGRVLGKGGETKRDLENRSNTIVNIDQKEPGDEQKISFSGSREDVDLAKHVYALMACESGGKCTLPLGKAVRRELQIPQGKVGLVIGPKGDMIRHLTQVTRCKIQVDHSLGATDPKLPARKVTITGLPRQLDVLEALVDAAITGGALPAQYALPGRPGLAGGPHQGGMGGG